MKMFSKEAATTAAAACVLAVAGRGLAAGPTLTDLVVVQGPMNQTLVMDPSGNLYGEASGIFELSGPTHQTISYLPEIIGGISPLTIDSAGTCTAVRWSVAPTSRAASSNSRA